MDTQAADLDHDTASEPDARTLRVQKTLVILFGASLLATLCTDAAHSQVRAFKLKRGHVSQLIVDQEAQIARMTEVGVCFDVLLQHRSGPEDQDIDSRWTRVDSIITCFLASIVDPKIRAKAILNDRANAIEIRHYAGGILIIEPTEARIHPRRLFSPVPCRSSPTQQQQRLTRRKNPSKTQKRNRTDDTCT